MLRRGKNTRIDSILAYIAIITIVCISYRGNFQFFIFSLLCFSLFVYLGFGLTILICPKSLRRYTLFLSPMVGYGYLTLAGWYFYILDFKGSDEYYTLALIIPAILLAFELFRTSKLKKTGEIFDREFLAPLILAFIAFTILSYTSLNEPFLTSVSLGNNDISAYSLVSRILKEMPKSNLTGYAKQNPHLIFLVDKSVFGAYLPTILFSSTFGLETYQVQNIVINVFFIFSALLVYCIARDMFNYNKFSSLGVTALYSLSPIMYYTIFNIFQSQIIATPISLAIVWLNWHLVRTRGLRKQMQFILPLILFNWSFSLTYPHMLPITYAVITAITLILSVYLRSYRQFLSWLGVTIIIFFAVFLLSPFRATALVEYFFFMEETTPLICISAITPDMLYGLTLEKVDLIPHTLDIRIPLSLLLVVVVIYGLVRAFYKDRKVFILSTSIIFTIFVGYILLVLPGEEQQKACGQPVFAGYKHYKLLSFFYPLLLVGSLVLFSDLRLCSKGKEVILLGIFLTILFGNLVSAFFMTTNMNRVHLAVKPATAELSSIEANNNVKSINLPKARGLWWTLMWEHNFLLKKELYDEQATYYPKTELRGEWNLYRDDIQDAHIIRSGIITQRYVQPPEVIRINKDYSIVSNSRFFAVLGEGWHENEVDHQWTSSNISTILVYSKLDDTRINLDTTYYPFERSNQLSVYWNNGMVMNYTSNLTCSIEIVLNDGVNVLEFRSLRPPTGPSKGGESRALGYSFSSITLSEEE